MLFVETMIASALGAFVAITYAEVWKGARSGRADPLLDREPPAVTLRRWARLQHETGNLLGILGVLVLLAGVWMDIREGIYIGVLMIAAMFGLNWLSDRREKAAERIESTQPR